MAQGKEIALKEALKIDLDKNHLYHSLLAELYLEIDQQKHVEHLKIAWSLTDNENNKRILKEKLNRAIP